MVQDWAGPRKGGEDKWNIRQAVEADRPAIEAVLDAAFGTDRHQRTAYRVREGMAPIASLSRVAEENGRIIASLQCWPVELRTPDQATPLVMLGPVAVLPELHRPGVGQAVMQAKRQAADEQGGKET